MGFDINLSLDLQMCEKTGRPYVYGRNLERVYDIVLTDYVIPAELRRYATGRGPIFYVYTKYFNERDTYTASTDMFLEEFPSWIEVEGSEEYDEYSPSDWSEEDHDNFKALLEWCSKHWGSSFRLSWCY